MHWKKYLNGDYGEKVVEDLNIDNRGIVSNLNTIARESLRTANYLDGHTLKRLMKQILIRADHYKMIL